MELAERGIYKMREVKMTKEEDLEKKIRKMDLIRKFLSLYILIFALIYYFFDKKVILITLSALLILFLPFDLMNYFSKGKNKISKWFFKLYPKKRLEKKHILSDASIFFIFTIFLVLLLQKDIVVFSLILFTFCDPIEKIFGILFPYEKLPWNKDKNWMGTSAGFLVSILAGFLAISCLNINLPLWIIFPTSFIAALAGTSPKYDNILIPWSIAILTTIILN